MGAAYSAPVELDNQSSSVCISFRNPNKIRILNGTQEVIAMLEGIVSIYRIDSGMIEFKLYGSSPFAAKSSKEDSTYGKKIAITILEDMYKMGYDLIVSTDLSRTEDRSSWFFQKAVLNRDPQKIFCISPGESDKIALYNGSDDIAMMIEQVLISSCHGRVIHEQFKFFFDEVLLHEFNLMSNIWGSSGEQSIALKEVLLSIIIELGKKHWKLYCTTTLKNNGSTFFFIFDEAYSVESDELMLISLNRHNRVRFINCPSSLNEMIKEYFNNSHQLQDCVNYCGSFELKLYGSPWNCKGYEALIAKYIFTSFMSFMHNKGWKLISSFYCSKKVTRKSVFLMNQTNVQNFLYGCISMSGRNKLHLIDLPPALSDKLKDDILQNYVPGISHGFDRIDTDFRCLEFKLEYDPWCMENSNDTSGLHARKLLMTLIGTAISCNWSVCASIDISSQCCNTEDDSYPENVQSLLLRTNDCAPSYFDCIGDPPPYPEEDPPPKYEDLFDT